MNIYLEVENYNREMESRILLGMEAARSGHKIYISDRVQIIENAKQNKLEPGVIFLKDINSQKYLQESIKIISENGFVIIGTDEEAGIQFDEYEDFIKARSIRTFNNIDIFICWGLRDKKMLKKKFDKSETKFLALGSPRIDLCKLKILKKKNFFSLKKKIKNNYILISSNISFNLGIRPMPEYVNNRVSEDKIDAEWREKYIYYKFTNHTEICYHFVKLIRRLAEEFPDRQIVIRPHPNETSDAWKKILINKYKNIKIIKSGSIADYIYNSEILIHSGCTSGIESYLMGKKSISFLPVELKFSIDRGISDEISILCKNDDEVINQLKMQVDKTLKTNKKLKERIMNYKNSMSYKKICNIFNKIEKTKKFKSIDCENIFLKKKNNFSKFKKLLKNFIKNLININDDKFLNEKFPILQREDISEKINELKNVNKNYNKISFSILNNKTIKIFKD